MPYADLRQRRRGLALSSPRRSTELWTATYPQFVTHVASVPQGTDITALPQDYAVEFVFTYNNAVATTIRPRYVDGQNQWLLNAQTNGTLLAQYRTANVTATMTGGGAGATFFTNGSTYRISTVVDGLGLTVWVNRVMVMTATVPSGNGHLAATLYRFTAVSGTVSTLQVWKK